MVKLQQIASNKQTGPSSNLTSYLAGFFLTLFIVVAFYVLLAMLHFDIDISWFMLTVPLLGWLASLGLAIGLFRYSKKTSKQNYRQMGFGALTVTILILGLAIIFAIIMIIGIGQAFNSL